MNKQDKQEPNNQQSVTEDLTLNEAEVENVKGGAYRPAGYEWAKQVKA